MLRADVENDCTWLSEIGIMDYSLIVGIGHLRFGDDLQLKDGPLKPIRAKGDMSVTKRSYRKILSLNCNDKIDDTSLPLPSLPHTLCKEDSLHSSFQSILQSAPWFSVWQEHWV